MINSRLRRWSRIREYSLRQATLSCSPPSRVPPKPLFPGARVVKPIFSDKNMSRLSSTPDGASLKSRSRALNEEVDAGKR